MSESFSDLWTSSNPVKSQQTIHKTPRVVVRNNANMPGRSSPDAFAVLASTSSSQPSSRPIPPSVRQSVSSKLQAPSNSHSVNIGDAFGGLVSFGATSRESDLTIAQRAAKAEQERIKQKEHEKSVLESQGSFWDRFEAGSKLPAKSAAPANSKDASDLDLLSCGLTNFPGEKPVRAENSSHDTAAWDLDLISTPTIGVAPPTAQPSRSMFNIDDLETFGNTRSSSPKPPSRVDTPGSFDFGEREDILLGNGVGNDEEDDILGSLVKPVESTRRASPAVISKTPSPSSSLPPHILGQIVEMGFSVQQAKVALAATPTGLDVEAALEVLLQNVKTESAESHDKHTNKVVEAERKRKQHQEPSRPNGSPSSFTTPRSHEALSSTQQQVQEHTDKLLAQASSFGLSVFNKANALWKDGRERVVKAYEEQLTGNADTDTVKARGLPRWMDRATIGAGDNFPYQDSDGTRQKNTQFIERKADPVSSQTQSSQYSPTLLETDGQVYKSPARHHPPAPSKSRNSSRVTTPAPVTAPPPISRPNVAVSPSALAISCKYKVLGTEHFKLGRYAEAEAAYSSAIESLPSSHLLRIPLYNNRAITRLKTGDYKGTVADTSEVILIVTVDEGAAWHPGREVDEQPGMELGDSLRKALRRRAEAYEGLEKWKEAMSDWESLSAKTWVSGALRGEAVKSVGRCRRLLTRGLNFTPAPGVIPSPESKPAPPSAAAHPSEALTRVRAANNAQEAEDQARYELKDTVDARLAAWRTGKETNIRALIASLDTVLWPSLGWQSVSMSELISPGQVKVRYTKAIAKLHPDKLNVNNTTLEQRMIANGVFGTLNEAWNAFR